MTKKEADFIGSMNMCDEISNEAYKKILCNCDVEEKEPCEDCISREEVLKVMCDNCPMYNCVCGCSSYRHIERMESVTPQQKIGKWIDVDSLDGALWHTCSECGETEFYATDYCPNCGAKMEVEE